MLPALLLVLIFILILVIIGILVMVIVIIYVNVMTIAVKPLNCNFCVKASYSVVVISTLICSSLTCQLNKTVYILNVAPLHCSLFH
jgi:hypothetical protein